MLLEGKSIVVTGGNTGIGKAIAGVAVFLASDKAGYVNATTVTIDGGLSQWTAGL